MKKFQFRLEAVLIQRKEKEEGALRMLASAQRALQAEHEQKAQLVRELDGALARRESLGTEPTSIQEFQLTQGYITGVKQRITQNEQAITRCTRGVEKAMRAYLLARRNTRMIETLKDKAQVEHKHEQAKAEQRKLDDLTVMRSRLRTMGDEWA